MVKTSLTPEQLKRAQEIYIIAREKTPADRREYLNKLSKVDQEYYKKEDNKARQKKFNRDPKNVERYNMERRDNIARMRLDDPITMAEQNLKDVKAFRLRQKQIKDEIEAKLKAKQSLTDAIKAKKARTELKQLKECACARLRQKEKKDIIGDILNSVIDTIPKQVQNKKNREAVARHRSKKEAGEPVKTYNTRSKKKA